MIGPYSVAAHVSLTSIDEPALGLMPSTVARSYACSAGSPAVVAQGVSYCFEDTLVCHYLATLQPCNSTVS